MYYVTILYNAKKNKNFECIKISKQIENKNILCTNLAYKNKTKIT